ncbi:unnamed protein product [Hydatigera taeniaeformis]|uniref:PH domain-containing protein n=1 Tax=Hydatigena taeniaeformis TaxID=6205 RepID=A0A0R3WR05_HYDTA|nr:unnamed protein product [Hydatigera taeniaeformis]
MFRRQETDTSSSSSSNAEVRTPPLTQAPSVQSDYCFEDARLRETTNAQKLLDLPINDKQSLIAKGILTKICRRRPKQRTFFLFNDTLVYANVSYGKLLAHPHAFPLEEVTVSDVNDSGIYRHGFIIETPKKSFTVYASIAEEKRRWVLVITQSAEAARQAAGRGDAFVALMPSLIHVITVCLTARCTKEAITPTEITCMDSQLSGNALHGMPNHRIYHGSASRK